MEKKNFWMEVEYKEKIPSNDCFAKYEVRIKYFTPKNELPKKLEALEKEAKYRD